MATIALEQTEKEIGGNRYLITALDALTGLDVMNNISESESKGEPLEPGFIKRVIMKSVTINNKQMTGDVFDKIFSRKYKELSELFGEIVKFNFGEGEDSPNAESDTSEE